MEEGRCGALVDERDYQALAAEMTKITRTQHSFSEMGALASESVAAHFEQRFHIAQLEGYYREAVEIANEAEARAGAEHASARAASFNRNGCLPNSVSGRFFRWISTAKKISGNRLSALARCSSICATRAALRRMRVRFEACRGSPAFGSAAF